MPENSAALVQELSDKIRYSRKYKHLDIPEKTIFSLFEIELPRHKTVREAEEAVRHKLHNIMAPYLGDPDYQSAAEELKSAFISGDRDGIRTILRKLLCSHASTRERFPVQERFYQEIFTLIGKPVAILDLACGLNPFAFPWMGLPGTVKYYAYDIHKPRIELINQYFSLQGLEPLAEMRDVLLNPPAQEADIAFLFKEAHRMEMRQRGCSLPMWKAIRVKTLLVSLPASSLSGKHDLAERQRSLVYGILDGMDWPVTELLIENEMVFCIKKS